MWRSLPPPVPPLFLLLLSPLVSSAKLNNSGTVWATPHASYSSSIGVLGCKVDTNRIAYWPEATDCDDICVELSRDGRSLKLLRVDQSQGAYDISYDAWNYLYTGYSATKKPTSGGTVEMTYKAVDAGECSDLIDTKHGKLPLSAANSMNFLASCLDQNDSWVAENHVLYNILDSICTLGYDEECDLNWPAANQPTCPHTLGLQAELTTDPVYNIAYPSGETVLASNGSVVTTGDGDDDSRGSVLVQPSTAAALGWLLACSLILGTWV